MKQQDAKPEQALPHDLILEGRNRLTATGVRRVLRCDAEGAALLTSKGTLELTGAELSITSLDLDKGEVKLAGRVDTLGILQSTRRAVFCAASSDDGSSPPARCGGAGDAGLRAAGRCARRGPGRPAHPGAGGLFARPALCGLRADGPAGLCRLPESGRAAAGLYGAGGILHRRCGAGGAPASVCGGRSLGGPGAAGACKACGPVHRPVESRPCRRQSTAERKKTCKKTEKELANTAAYVV